MTAPSTSDVQERLSSMLEAFCRLTHRFLLEAPNHQQPWAIARSYLEKQGFTPDRLDRLPIGHFVDCPTVNRALKGAGFSAQEIDASELAADPRLDGRLLGPIRDSRGSVKSFWAHDPLGKRPEYLFKGKWKEELGAFGLDVALPALAHGRHALVLVESLLDALLLHCRGFPGVAAVAGPAAQLTRKRWERLAGLGVLRVKLVVRPDEAGRHEGGQHRAAVALENATQAKPSPQVWVVPQERLEGLSGPGEFVRVRGLDAFRQILEPPGQPLSSTNERLHKPGFCPLHRCPETWCFCFD